MTSEVNNIHTKNMTTLKSQTAKIITNSSVEFLNNHEIGMNKAIESCKSLEISLRQLQDHVNADKQLARYMEMEYLLNEFQDFRTLLGK